MVGVQQGERPASTEPDPILIGFIIIRKAEICFKSLSGDEAAT